MMKATLRVVVGLLGMLACVSYAAADDRPNVLLILADDLGYSDPGYMGGEIHTPNLDRLAAEGVRFTQCYNSARCCPSRASLMTGLYPHQAGIGSFTSAHPDLRRGPAYLGHLNDQCVTLAEALKTAGYHNYMVGKWHMQVPGPIARGFDEFYGFVHGYEQDQWEPSRYQRLPEGRAPELKYESGEFYATDVFTDYALEFLKQARQPNSAGQHQPWFMYLAHSAPHFPVQAPHDTVAKYLDTYRAGWDVLRKARFERMQKLGLAQDSWVLTDRSPVPVDRNDIANGYSGQQNPAWADLPADRREDLAHRMAIFAAMVDHLDTGLGRILADLEAHHELDNTLILFLSDNGACYEWGPFGFDGPSRSGKTILHTGDELEKMGGPGTYHAYGSAWSNLCNTPLRMYKHFTYEGGNCTSMVVHWPKGIAQADRWVRTPVHVMDVMPTLLEVCGAQYPTHHRDVETTPLEGASLMPLLKGKSLPERPIASEHNEARSLRRGDWKVVWPVHMPWDSAWELYNIAADRCETHNVAKEHPKLTRELAQAWEAWAKHVKVYPFYKPEGFETYDPPIQNRPLKITAHVALNATNVTGVILAQGGREYGYALHLKQGQLIFSVRRNTVVTATTPVPLGGRQADLEAELLKDGAMVLRVDGKVVAEGNAGGLIERQPVDALCIGRDDQSAVGDYQPPLMLKGKGEVTHVTVNGTAFGK